MEDTKTDLPDPEAALVIKNCEIIFWCLLACLISIVIGIVEQYLL